MRLALALLAAMPTLAVAAVWPLPASISTGDKAVWIKPDVQFRYVSPVRLPSAEGSRNALTCYQFNPGC